MWSKCQFVSLSWQSRTFIYFLRQLLMFHKWTSVVSGSESKWVTFQVIASFYMKVKNIQRLMQYTKANSSKQFLHSAFGTSKTWALWRRGVRSNFVCEGTIQSGDFLPPDSLLIAFPMHASDSWGTTDKWYHLCLSLIFFRRYLIHNRINYNSGITVALFV